MSIVKVDYGEVGGGGMKFVKQDTAVSNTQNVTITGLTKIDHLWAAYGNNIYIAYGYDDGTGNFVFGTDKATYIKINSVTGNVVNLSIYSSETISFYAYGN